MSTYVIGDVQGCFKTFEKLLLKINFNPEKDYIWFLGDLVNIGNNSLKALKWAYKNKDICNTLIGNHEMNLLCISEGLAKIHEEDTVEEILTHKRKDEWLEWVRNRPLIHEHGDYLLVHAGLHPSWSLSFSRKIALEVEEALRGPDYRDYLQKWKKKYYKTWEEGLSEKKRFSTALNVMTKMRFLDEEQKLVKKAKGELQKAEEGLTPWFRHLHPTLKKKKILFGHWSAVGVHQENNITALDSGAVWGRMLTAFCLETEKITQVSAHAKDLPSKKE